MNACQYFVNFLRITFNAFLLQFVDNISHRVAGVKCIMFVLSGTCETSQVFWRRSLALWSGSRRARCVWCFTGAVVQANVGVFVLYATRMLLGISVVLAVVLMPSAADGMMLCLLTALH